MSYVDWIFALHLLTAATLVGGFVMTWIVVVALRTASVPDATLSLNRVAMVGAVVIVVGLLGTIALGIWTAILRPELRPWHGWAIAAIVLWAIAAAAVLGSFVEYAKPVAKARELIASGLTGPSEKTALNRTSTGLLLRGAPRRLAALARRRDSNGDAAAQCLPRDRVAALPGGAGGMPRTA